jgi:C4-type Zn-finger protein
MPHVRYHYRARRTLGVPDTALVECPLCHGSRRCVDITTLQPIPTHVAISLEMTAYCSECLISRASIVRADIVATVVVFTKLN